MEVCEEISMVNNMRKRQCMDDVMEQSHNKRACKGLNGIRNGNGILVHPLNECDLIYWQVQLSQDKNTSTHEFISKMEVQQNSMNFQNYGNAGSSQPCQRCIAGESGHINHILGL
ncbi:uncharacterized protein C10orf143 homolog [Bombina bombina]|uniref:uncharacterized protein C10orf143 homolog n=1 Tax=Bombina bombina TaxID=8345 RepID=UPI00235B309A|nr:uncharacterized protein C10orf143 homolog [Bombina bombina]